MTTLALSRPTLSARAHYGMRVVSRAIGVLTARARSAPRAERGPLPFNTMFDTARLGCLEAERRELERFDLYLFDVMNSPVLRGQIVFEYGTLVRAIDGWQRRRVLDVGTGRSTFPRWISAKGASVTTFDLAAPVEVPSTGFQERVDHIVARRPGVVRPVAGSMLRLPFADGAFDLVTSASVLEHLDTDLPGRTYVDYPEQQRRLAIALDEMLRVTAPGGLVYITSECCDYDRATSDSWRGAYYCVDGPPLSAAWPVGDVGRLFYRYLIDRGCVLVDGLDFDPNGIACPERWTSRGPFFSGFAVLARKIC
jgi:SAM-dependent methyltransferase